MQGHASQRDRKQLVRPVLGAFCVHVTAYAHSLSGPSLRLSQGPAAELTPDILQHGDRKQGLDVDVFVHVCTPFCDLAQGHLHH